MVPGYRFRCHLRLEPAAEDGPVQPACGTRNVMRMARLGEFLKFERCEQCDRCLDIARQYSHVRDDTKRPFYLGATVRPLAFAHKDGLEYEGTVVRPACSRPGWHESVWVKYPDGSTKRYNPRQLTIKRVPYAGYAEVEPSAHVVRGMRSCHS